MAKHKTRGGIGTNQYGIRGVSKIQDDQAEQIALRWLRIADMSVTQLQLKAATNPKCPPEILTELATNPDVEVRIGVASHPDCPPDVFVSLADDAHPHVHKALVKNPNVSISALDRLCESPDLGVRIAVAKHPQTTIAILDHLAQVYTKNQEDLGMPIVSNSDCSPEALEMMRAKGGLHLGVNNDIAVAIGHHRNASAATL